MTKLGTPITHASIKRQLYKKVLDMSGKGKNECDFLLESLAGVQSRKNVSALQDFSLLEFLTLLTE